MFYYYFYFSCSCKTFLRDVKKKHPIYIIYTMSQVVPFFYFVIDLNSKYMDTKSAFLHTILLNTKSNIPYSLFLIDSESNFIGPIIRFNFLDINLGSLLSASCLFDTILDLVDNYDCVLERSYFTLDEGKKTVKVIIIFITTEFNDSNV